MKLYSHSKLSTFEQCALKYKFKYIDKIKPEIEKTIEAHLGSAVHSTLEWLYNLVKDEKKVPTIDELITYYSVEWQNEFSNEILIVKKEMSAKDYFNKGVQFIISYYSKHQPFQDGTIDVEKKITIRLGEAGTHRIIGFIDRLSQNLETGELEVHDYKTARTIPPQEKLDEDRQLALYAIAIKEEFGKEKPVKLVWHYLAHNQIVNSSRTDEQLQKLKEDTINLIKEIEATKEFPHTKSILCKWCEYKSICPAWKEEFQAEKIKKEQPKEIRIDGKKYPTIHKYIKD